MSASRLLEMVYLLLERRQVTAQELAQRFEVSVRTIYRDVDRLSGAGVPVYTCPGRGGGIALVEDWVLQRSAFSQDEQDRLLTALQSLPGALEPENREGLAKLAGLFGRREPDWLQVDLSRWGAASEDSAKFRALKEAIQGRRTIRFLYLSASGTSSARTVFPARLVFKGQAWYLQGWCLARSAWRTFRLTRMLELETDGAPFDPLPAPPPVEPEDPQPPFQVPVKLRFSPWMAYRVYDAFDPACITREADGAVTVETSFPEDSWLYGCLLSFGAGVEVLSPPALRRRLGLLAREIWLGCGEPDTPCQGMGGKMGLSQQEEENHMDPNQRFCQSCGMPLGDPALLGTEADGSASPDYCKYCYQNGAFTADMTMEQMIDFCTPIMAQSNPGMTPEQARAQMHQFFPLLLRWRRK